MSEARRCDWCGAVSESTTPMGWFHLELLYPMRTWSDPDGGWDFSSSACLEAWAEKRKTENR